MRKFGRRVILTGLALFLFATAPCFAAEADIVISIRGHNLPARLADNPVSRELQDRLPQRLAVDDSNGIEKTGKIARRLLTDGVPAGYAPRAGDIVYYAPWGNLVFFYKDFRYYEGLIYLGHIEDSLEALAIPGETLISISR